MFKIRSLTTINACNNLYLSSGSTINNDFGTNGYVNILDKNSVALSVVFDSNGNFFVNDVTKQYFSLYKYSSNGSLDDTFKFTLDQPNGYGKTLIYENKIYLVFWYEYTVIIFLLDNTRGDIKESSTNICKVNDACLHGNFIYLFCNSQISKIDITKLPYTPIIIVSKLVFNYLTGDVNNGIIYSIIKLDMTYPVYYLSYNKDESGAGPGIKIRFPGIYNYGNLTLYQNKILICVSESHSYNGVYYFELKQYIQNNKLDIDSSLGIGGIKNMNLVLVVYFVLLLILIIMCTYQGI